MLRLEWFNYNYLSIPVVSQNPTRDMSCDIPPSWNASRYGCPGLAYDLVHKLSDNQKIGQSDSYCEKYGLRPYLSLEANECGHGRGNSRYRRPTPPQYFTSNLETDHHCLPSTLKIPFFPLSPEAICRPGVSLYIPKLDWGTELIFIFLGPDRLRNYRVF